MDRPGRNQQQHGRRQDSAGATQGEKQQSLAENGVNAPKPHGATPEKSDNDKKA
ncbi:hypothetical protein ACFSX5_14185 [Devosia albogilva]|uniref:Uncharacterized protein n=1 Tax=Devosia albogilva TaxID=429726 RepID=A0ABW5QML9_9HYPH